MNVSFSELFRHLYPQDKPRSKRKIDGFSADHWRPLKCVVCGVKVSRYAYKLHGNPYCGPHYPGVLGIEELVHKSGPVFFRRTR